MITSSNPKSEQIKTATEPNQTKFNNHRKTCGRYFTELQSINWWKVAKVTFVAGLLLTSPFIPVLAACASSYLYGRTSDDLPERKFQILPSVNAASTLPQLPKCLPIVKPTISKGQFPLYTAEFSKPGMRLVFAGTHGCSIENGIERDMVCQYFIETVLKRADADQNLHRLKRDPGYEGKEIAIPVQLDDGRIKSLFFNLNSRAYKNHKNALQLIEQTILVNGFANDTSVSETLDTIKKINSILMEGLSKMPGQFRTQEVEEKMQAFIQEVRDASNQKNDAIDLASFVYLRFKEINPFYKGCDLQAELLLNTALLYFGNYDPVVIYDSQGFKESAMKGQSALADYIRCHLLPWTEKHKAIL